MARQHHLAEVTTHLTSNPSPHLDEEVSQRTTQGRILALQRSAGNRAVGQVLGQQSFRTERCGEEMQDGWQGAVLPRPHTMPTPRLARQSPGNVVIQRQEAALGGSGDGFDPECKDILGRILSFLYGGMTHVVGGVRVTGAPLKRGIIERFTQLLEDSNNLYVKHRTVGESHPQFGSWEGHQQAYEQQQRGLREALNRWRARCGGPGGGGGPAGARSAVEIANHWSTRPVPAQPKKASPIQGQPIPLYSLVLDGRNSHGLTAEQATTMIRSAAERITRRIDMQSGEQKLIQQNNDEHPIISWISEGLGGASMPPLSIWDHARTMAIAALSATESGDVATAVKRLAMAAKSYERAYRAYATYKDNLFEGAETAVLGAEVTAVAAAVVFVAAGAAVVGAATAAAAATGGTASATTSTAVMGTAAAGASTSPVGGAVVMLVATDSAAGSAALAAASLTAENAAATTTMAAAAAALIWTQEDEAMAAGSL